MYQLHSDTLSLTFCEKTGALTGLRDKRTGWDILRRPELGLSWRLLVPVSEELRNNPVLGEKQILTESRLETEAITLVWDGVDSERAGRLDIKITTVIRLEDGQAVWNTTVENRSPYVVEAVHSPYLGDLTPPKNAAWLKSYFYNYGTAVVKELWPKFENNVGYSGTDYPAQLNVTDTINAYGSTPAMPFTLIQGDKMGLYAGVKERSFELVAWHYELQPGWDSSMNETVPKMDTIAGKPVHTMFCAIHMCYIMPGETRSLTPVALQPYAGDWHTGCDIYKKWRDTVSKAAKAPDWANEPHSWLQIHINSPEDELRLRFCDLPKVAEECVHYGIRAIQLVGWNDGGQDQGNPSHEPDPRLGTFEELKEAIAACQAMGVKIILFAKFTWADRATDWFRNELINYAVKDPYGDYYHYCGYKYATPTQFLDINTKRLIPMCFGSEAYMDICRKEFRKFIELGCDGFLFDECPHHSPALLCFDESHGHRLGWPVYSRDCSFIEELAKEEGLREDFLFSGEALYDWEQEVYSLSYFRSHDQDHLPLTRYLRPEAQIMTALTGFEDRDMVNQCLLYRYLISHEPFNFKGWPHDYPDTIAYGNLMDELRTELRDYFWDGEFCDTLGATVTTEDGTAHHPYSVFLAKDGSRGLVICNYTDESIRVKASVKDTQALRCRLVDNTIWQSGNEWICLPPHSAAVALPAEK